MRSAVVMEDMARGAGAAAVAYRLCRGARRMFAALALCPLLAAPVLAERADRDREANVTADHSTLDDLHQVQVLTGHVLLIKGTMRLTGERMEHRQDEQGYQYYVVTAAPGELASFHERRDPVRVGVESTLDGFAERIEYDDRSDRVILLRRALVKRYENGEQRDELSGSRIIYDARQSNYDVDGRNPDGTGARVHIVIAPRSGGPAPAPGAAPARPGNVPANAPGNTSGNVPPATPVPAPATPSPAAPTPLPPPPPPPAAPGAPLSAAPGQPAPGASPAALSAVTDRGVLRSERQAPEPVN